MSSTMLISRSTDAAYGAGILTLSIRHAWLALGWCLIVAGTAWAQADVVTIIKEEPICSDTDDPFIDVPVNVCNVFVHLEEPSVKLLAAGYADITTDDPAGFFQHPSNGVVTAPSCFLISLFPSLVCDSFVTIGLKCGPDPAGTDKTAPDGDFDAAEFNLNGHVVGGWFNADPDNSQGLPNENGDVLVAQLAVTEGFDIFGSFTAFVQGDFGPPLDCADFDGNRTVGAFDLAFLLGNWGDCPPECPADLNGDGTVDVVDLVWLLSTWGPCAEKTLPFEAVELEFSCFASICEIDEDCDDDDPCTSDMCVEGVCENPPADCNDNGTPDCDDIAEQTSADCNGNSIPDECDIGGGTSQDCNGNGIPDECEEDCNANGTPDDCDVDPADPDGNGQVSDDCNSDGIPDECEIDENSPAPGGPFFCTENCDPDCNNNGIPDECDIADCTPQAPACDDCNLNGVPDECDIDSGFSEDVDGNGVPDECVAAQSDGDWSADIWGLEGENPYPDSQEGVPDLTVTVGGVSVFLDVDAEVPALRVIDAATLDVTQDGDAGDLTIADAGGMFDGNLLIQGTLNIGGGRVIDATGTVTIGTGGVYKSIFGLEGPGSGDLMADEIVVACGGTLKLEGTMNVDTQRDIILQESDGKGSCTPPDFETGDDSTAAVGGDFTIQGPVNIDYTSTQPLLLGGDFDNQSTDAEIFDWSAGGILLNGPMHTIEAAGRERGPCLSGLVDNFAFGSLTLAKDTLVQVVDAFDNQGDGLAACDEPLYLDLLEVSAGATLVTEGCRVYFKQLVLAEGGSIPGLGTDVLQILEGCPPDFDNDGEVNAFDLATLLGAWGPCPEPCTPGQPAGTCATDLNGDCVTEAFDLASLLGSWGPV